MTNHDIEDRIGFFVAILPEYLEYCTSLYSENMELAYPMEYAGFYWNGFHTVNSKGYWIREPELVHKRYRAFNTQSGETLLKS